MSERDGARPRIVAGVDGSPASLAALQWAVGQAAATGGTVQAVIAWQYPSVIGGYGWAPVALAESSGYEEIAQKTLAGAIAAVDSAGRDVPVTSLVREGNAAQVLVDAAADAELLVVGSRGHGGFAGALLGSVSLHCVHHAPCPVAVIRSTAKT